jgi:hypothetical protein
MISLDEVARHVGNFVKLRNAQRLLKGGDLEHIGNYIAKGNTHIYVGHNLKDVLTLGFHANRTDYYKIPPEPKQGFFVGSIMLERPPVRYDSIIGTGILNLWVRYESLGVSNRSVITIDQRLYIENRVFLTERGALKYNEALKSQNPIGWRDIP